MNRLYNLPKAGCAQRPRRICQQSKEKQHGEHLHQRSCETWFVREARVLCKIERWQPTETRPVIKFFFVILATPPPRPMPLKQVQYLLIEFLSFFYTTYCILISCKDHNL
eukprot:g67951.t1